MSRQDSSVCIRSPLSGGNAGVKQRPPLDARTIINAEIRECTVYREGKPERKKERR